LGISNKMVLGVNLPWSQSHYGFDFGPTILTATGETPKLRQWSITGWNTKLSKATTSATSDPKPTTILELQLSQFKALGIQVVRWFILADGWNLGDPPSPKDMKWDYHIPRLDSSFVQHFSEALKSFETFKIQLIPVLIDYLFFGPGVVILQDPYKLEGHQFEVPVSAESVDTYVRSIISSQVPVMDNSDPPEPVILYSDQLEVPTGANT
jgi:hypothetical protein